MTKKIVSLFLAIAMMLMSIPALAENTEAVSIEPTLSAIMDRNTSEWLESDASRVLLTTCVLIDVLLSDYEQLSDVAANAVVNGKVYLAVDEEDLCVYFFGTEYTLLVIFDPIAEIMVGNILGQATSDPNGMMVALQGKDLFSRYYPIAGTDILTMYQLILEELQK